MNITIESLLCDAKFLVTRLKEHDSAAENLAEQAATLQKEMEARNTYQENLIELNKVAGHRPRSTLVLGIQQENCAIRSLQQENDELRQSLIDHQNALELIMTKYRQQMMAFTKEQNLQISNDNIETDKQYRERNMELIEKICEMASVMQRAAELDDKEFYKDYEELCRLQAENQSLRELLMISKSTQGAKLLMQKEKFNESQPGEDRESPQKTVESSPQTIVVRKIIDVQTSTKDSYAHLNDDASQHSDDTLVNGEDLS